jgi:hypothetical protein
MDWVFRGVYLIGDKKTGRITNVQVEDNIRGRQHSLPFASISRAASSRTPKRFRGRKT